jgi:hypothetical protein
MTEPFDEYGERLRRVLHTKADAVAPSPEGLERIRTKINERRDRRLGLWYAVPWLRPLAAVGAAVFICLVAVSATPALKNFVQTGHFSPDDRGNSGQTVAGDGQSDIQTMPGESAPPGPSISPRPSTIRPTTPGKHVVTGSCPPGEGTVSPTRGTRRGGQPVTSGPTPRVTCQPRGSTSVPTTPQEPTTPPYSSPVQSPTSEQPTTGVQPSAQGSP